LGASGPRAVAGPGLCFRQAQALLRRSEWVFLAGACRRLHACCVTLVRAAQVLATAVTLPLTIGLALLLGWNLHLALANKTTIEYHEGVTARVRVRGARPMRRPRPALRSCASVSASHKHRHSFLGRRDACVS